MNHGGSWFLRELFFKIIFNQKCLFKKKSSYSLLFLCNDNLLQILFTELSPFATLSVFHFRIVCILFSLSAFLSAPTDLCWEFWSNRDDEY